MRHIVTSIYRTWLAIAISKEAIESSDRVIHALSKVLICNPESAQSRSACADGEDAPGDAAHVPSHIQHTSYSEATSHNSMAAM